MSSRLRHLQPAFADLLPDAPIWFPGTLGTHYAGVQRPRPDHVLADLRIRNLSRAIADGRVDGMAQLGVLIGLALTGEGQERRSHE